MIRPSSPTLDAIKNGTAANELVALDGYINSLAGQTPLPTPVPIPIPVPPTPPTGLTRLWLEDLTSYVNTADLLARFCNRLPGMQQSSQTGAVTRDLDSQGNPMLGLHWPGSGLGPTPTISPRWNPSPKFTALQIKWSEIYSSGFQILGEYKAFLIKLGPNTNSGMPQIGVYLEPNGSLAPKVKMDVTDRVNNLNTGSPLLIGGPNTVIKTASLPPNWNQAGLDWELNATGLCSLTAQFELRLMGQPIIAFSGPFLPTISAIGLPTVPAQVLIFEPGSNINVLPQMAQTRWIERIEVNCG